jgi:hypothetical protein
MKRPRITKLNDDYAKLLRWIVKYVVEHHGRFPTYREMMGAKVVSASTSTARYKMDVLERLGYLGHTMSKSKKKKYYIKDIVIQYPQWWWDLDIYEGVERPKP